MLTHLNAPDFLEFLGLVGSRVSDPFVSGVRLWRNRVSKSGVCNRSQLVHLASRVGRKVANVKRLQMACCLKGSTQEESLL